jgi:hypothetical protein
MNSPAHRLHAFLLAAAACLLPASLVAQAAPLATFPATNVGSSSLPQSVTFTLPAAATISSIAPVLSVGGETELKIGTLSGCVADGTTTNQAGSICVVQVTFTPAYVGLHSLPIEVVTSAGTLQLGTVGTGVGAVMAFSPGITTIVAGTNCTNYQLNCGVSGIPDGGLATNGYLSGVTDFAIDAAGNIFLLMSADSAVHKIDATTGIITRVAGGGCCAGDGGLAIDSSFYNPVAMAVDPAGDLYIADNQQTGFIRRVDAGTGIITNYAGCCYKGTDPRVGVPAQQAILGGIAGLAFDGAGNLYITQNTYILRVDAVTTIVTSYVGPTPPSGSSGATARGYSGDGGLATNALIQFPTHMSFDSAGNLYFADQGAFGEGTVVRRVDAVTSIITTYAGNLNAKYDSTYSGPATNTYVYILSVANDAAGNLYIGDGGVVRLVSASSGNLFPIAGIALPLPAVLLPVQRATDINNAAATKLDPAGNLYTFFGVGLNETVLRKIDVTSSLLGFPFRTSSNIPPTAPGTPYPGANTETTAITNIGNAPLILSAAPEVTSSTANPEAYALDDPATDGCPDSSNTLAPGNSCLLAVDFTPKIAGANLGTLTVTDNAINGGGAQVVSLAGSGFGNALTVTPATLTFPGTLVGSASASLTASVTNSAFNATPISPGTLGDTADYTETDNCGTSIAGNSSCTLTFTFKPQSLGATPSTFTLSGSIDPTQTITVSLTGTGSGAFSVSPKTITFPSTAVGAASASMTAALTNGGGSSLFITAGTFTDSTDFTQSNNCNGIIAPGTGCTVTFTFTPKSAGTLTSTYSVADLNNSRDVVSVALSGPATAPPVTATLSPSTFTFAATTASASASQTATLTNTGTTTLTITSIMLGGANPTAFTQSNACGATLAAGATCSVTLGLVNATSGNFSATLTVVDNATSGNQTATLSGTVTTAPVTATLSPSTFTFAATTASAAASQTATLTNTGTTTLTITSITLGGANPTAFTQSNTCGATLAVGATCSVTVGFPVTMAGTYSAMLTVTDNASPATQSVALSGTVTGTPQVTLAPVALSFTTTVGTSAATQIATLTNSGTAALTISTAVLGGSNASSFAIASSTCGTTLAVGASCSFTIGLSATAVGSYSAALTFTDNASPSTQSVLLTGQVNGVAAAELTPATASFGSVNTKATSASQTFTLANAGTAALTITSISVGGTSAAMYAVTANTCGTTIPGGASCTVAIAFSPTSSGNQEAALSVLDTVGTQTSALSGVGVAITPADFSITATPPAQSTFRGSTVSYTVEVASLVAGNPFSNLVSLSASGLPAGAMAKFSPAMVTPGNVQQTSTLTVEVPGLVSRVVPDAARPGESEGITPAMLALGLLLVRRARRRMSRVLSVLLLAGFVGLCFTMSGCGAGNGFDIPASTSTITVTATGGSTTHSTTVTLTIQ